MVIIPKIKFSVSGITEWLTALCIFLISTPVFTWTRSYIYWIAMFLYIFLSYSLIKIGTPRENLPKILLFIIYCYLILKYALINDNSFLFYIFIISTFIPFLFIKETRWYNIFRNYMMIFVITIIPSLLQYILVYFLGIDFPSIKIDSSPWNPHEGSTYIQYAFFVRELRSGDFLPRFYGLYDEPGVPGTIAMVFLYCNKYNLKKWYNIVLFFTGLLSFSLFFYVSTLLYTLFFGNIKMKLFTILICMSIMIFAYENEVISRYVFDRFTVTDGEWTGYNRENYEFNFYYNQLDIYEILFGVNLSRHIPFATSYKYPLAICGIISTCFFAASYLAFALTRLKFVHWKDLLLCLMIPLLVFAQRPFINNPFYIFLVFVPIYIFSIKYSVSASTKTYDQAD